MTTEPAKEEFQNIILKNEISELKKNNDTENMLSMLHCLHESAVFVPGKSEKINEGEETNTTRKKAKFFPAMIKDLDGKLIFPIFTSRDEAPSIGGLKPSGIVLPFITVAAMTASRPDCDTIIINPFTDKFKVSEQMYKNVLKMGHGTQILRERRIPDDSSVIFLAPEEADKEVSDKAVSVFNEYGKINRAYFTRMLNFGQLTYLFILNSDEDMTKTISEVSKKLMIFKFRLPISFTSEKAFSKFLDNEKIKLIYEKPSHDNDQHKNIP